MKVTTVKQLHKKFNPTSSKVASAVLDFIYNLSVGVMADPLAS